MTDATLVEVMDALASQIETRLTSQVAQLQVVGRFMLNPSVPSVDIYPAPDPFQEQSGFGRDDSDINFVIRARVSTVDQDGGQEILLAMMDPSGPASMVRAVIYDKTLGGKVQSCECDPPSDFGAYVEPLTQGKAYLGCTWLARVTV